MQEEPSRSTPPSAPPPSTSAPPSTGSASQHLSTLAASLPSSPDISVTSHFPESSGYRGPYALDHDGDAVPSYTSSHSSSSLPQTDIASPLAIAPVISPIYPRNDEFMAPIMTTIPEDYRSDREPLPSPTESAALLVSTILAHIGPHGTATDNSELSVPGSDSLFASSAVSDGDRSVDSSYNSAPISDESTISRTWDTVVNFLNRSLTNPDESANIANSNVLDENMNSELPISLSSSVPERCKSTSVGRRPPIISTLLKPLGVKSPPPKMAKAQTRKPRPYLPPLSDKDKDKKTLVLDLDGTLINSSMKPSKCSFVVQINGFADIYVLTRPGVEEFIQNMSAKYELVIFTAGKKEYADPIINNIDKNRLIRHRLYRESCSCYEKRAVKDLRNLGRDLKNVILLDNTPHCYSLQPQNGLAISSFTDDEEDTELMDLTPFLLLVAELDDVRESLNSIPRKTAN